MTMSISNLFEDAVEAEGVPEDKTVTFPQQHCQALRPKGNGTSDGRVYIVIKSGIPGLLQACILVQELLEERLNLHC